MKALPIVILVSLAILGILYLTNGKGRAEHAACIERGVGYFREIGSYPTLKSLPDRGRRAEDVAAERCRRSPRAFG